MLRFFIFFLQFFAFKGIKSQEIELPYPSRIEYNSINNSAITFFSDFFKENPLCVVFLGSEGFELLFPEKISVNKNFFEISIIITPIEGKYQFAVLLEDNTKEKIRIFYKKSKEEPIDLILQKKEYFFKEEVFLKNLRKEWIRKKTLNILGFYIFPLTTETSFCIHKIKLKKTSFL
ncbi:MAG: hypothetical protein ACK4UJ_09535 [Leptonema sp. (in: bacteria)]